MYTSVFRKAWAARQSQQPQNYLMLQLVRMVYIHAVKLDGLSSRVNYPTCVRLQHRCHSKERMQTSYTDFLLMLKLNCDLTKHVHAVECALPARVASTHSIGMMRKQTCRSHQGHKTKASFGFRRAYHSLHQIVVGKSDLRHPS